MAIIIGSVGNGDDILPGTILADVIDGLGGNDSLNGLAGDDVLIGGAGDDTMNGDDGSDALYPDAGADMIVGGAGWDYVFYTAAPGGMLIDLIEGVLNSGDAAGDSIFDMEVLVGSSFDDSLRGDSAGNFLYGGDGNDFLFGRDGADSLIGGAGNDTLVGGTGRDRLFGDAGDDAFYAGPSSDYADPGAGQNVIAGGGGYDVVFYNEVSHGIYSSLLNVANSHYAPIAAGDSYSEVEGLVGTEFADVLLGNGVESWIYGLGGDDLIDAGANGSLARGMHFIGGAGNDTLQGSEGEDWLYGDDGNDILRMYGGEDHVFGGAGDDKFEISGDPWRDWLDGGVGDDTFLIFGEGSFGGDNFIGGSGSDTIDMSLFGIGRHDGAALDLVDWAASTGQLGGATFDGIENVLGSQYNDSLRGNVLANALSGGTGDDWLYGRGGADELMGGAGSDTLFGNDGDDSLRGDAGADRFYFGTGDGRDSINDFADGVDTIYLARNLGIAAFTDVASRAVQSGTDVVITFDPGTTLTLVGVPLASLTVDDFGFF